MKCERKDFEQVTHRFVNRGLFQKSEAETVVRTSWNVGHAVDSTVRMVATFVR